jgi:NAD(P)-dependent dehydrogenase (short-subunit alcohol dehydrogenase family)
MAEQAVLHPHLFRDTVVLITGGGTGIGLAIARLVVSLGGAVAICGRRQAVLDEAAEGLEELSINAAGGSGGTNPYPVVDPKFVVGEGKGVQAKTRVLWGPCDIREVDACRMCVALSLFLSLFPPAPSFSLSHSLDFLLCMHAWGFLSRVRSKHQIL